MDNRGESSLASATPERGKRASSGLRMFPIGLTTCAVLGFIAILGALAVHAWAQRVDRAVSDAALASVAMYHVSQRHNTMVDGAVHTTGEHAAMMSAMRDFRQAIKRLEGLFDDEAGTTNGPFRSGLAEIGALVGIGQVPDPVMAVWTRDDADGSIRSLLRQQLSVCTELCTSPQMTPEEREAGLAQMSQIVVRTLLPRMRELKATVGDWQDRMVWWVKVIVLVACLSVAAAIVLTRFWIISPLLNRLDAAKIALEHRNAALEEKVRERTRDLTEAIDELTQAHQTRTRFLASVNHEMRTPMNGVLGVTALLARTPLTERQAQYVRMITQSGNTLIRLIDDVLDLVGLSTGRMELSLRTIDLKELVEDSVARLGPLAREKGLGVRIDTSDALPDQVVSDPDRMTQIINNLLGNAIKFTCSGHVTVILRQVARDDDQIETQLVFEDTGPGFDPEHIDRIFEPFERGIGSGCAPGAGLGLAITMALVEQMGGRIDVDTQVGYGTSMSVRITLKRAEEPYEAEIRVA